MTQDTVWLHYEQFCYFYMQHTHSYVTTIFRMKGLKSTQWRIIKFSVLSDAVNNLPNPTQVSKSLTLLTHLPYFFYLPHTNDTEMSTSSCELPMEYICKPLLRLTSTQQAAYKDTKPTPSAKTTTTTPNSGFLLGFSLNQNIRWLCRRSLVPTADKQNVQFQPWSSQEEALCDEGAFYFGSIRACAFSTWWHHPHNYTRSLVERYLYPSLEFDPTTTEADEAVMIVISTC